MDFSEIFNESTNQLSRSYYPTFFLFLHSTFKITAQFTKYRSHAVLNAVIIDMEEKF